MKHLSIIPQKLKISILMSEMAPLKTDWEFLWKDIWYHSTNWFEFHITKPQIEKAHKVDRAQVVVRLMKLLLMVLKRKWEMILQKPFRWPSIETQKGNNLCERCLVKDETYTTVVDVASSVHLASTILVNELKLHCFMYPRPNRFQWLKRKMNLRYLKWWNLPILCVFTKWSWIEGVSMNAYHNILVRRW